MRSYLMLFGASSAIGAIAGALIARPLNACVVVFGYLIFKAAQKMVKEAGK